MIVLKEMDLKSLDAKFDEFQKISKAYWKAMNELDNAVKEAEKQYYGDDNGLMGYIRGIKESITLDNGVIINREGYRVDAEMNVEIGVLKAYGNLYDSQGMQNTSYSLYASNGKQYDGYAKKYAKEREILEQAIYQYKISNPFKKYENLR